MRDILTLLLHAFVIIIRLARPGGLRSIVAESVLMRREVHALKLDRYSLYVMDYGAPVSFRLAVKHPERVQALVVQNGNAYEEGLRDTWIPFSAYWKDRSEQNAEPLKNFLTYEGRNRSAPAESETSRSSVQIRGRPISIGWIVPETKRFSCNFFTATVQTPLYHEWQDYSRKYQPPTLIVWGKNDPIFPAEGAEPYKRDLKTLEFHLLDTGHFALEEDGGKIARYMESFLDKQVKRPRTAA
jgi:pimeloyl-ACP methyl ester carboxylesterase